MAFEQVLRRWVHELGLSWAVVPIDEPNAEGSLRVGYTLRLHARPRGRGSALQDSATLGAPEGRLHALGLCLVGYEPRLAEYQFEVRKARTRVVRRDTAPDLHATLRVRLRTEHVQPSDLADGECAGEIGRRLRAFGAAEQGGCDSREPAPTRATDAQRSARNTCADTTVEWMNPSARTARITESERGRRA